jgi:hypothetical protein
MAETLTQDQAFDVLAENIHAPIFFDKLARVYGVRPGSVEDAHELLMIAGELRHAHQQAQVKQAAAATSVLQNARQDLAKVLRENGYQPLYDAQPSYQPLYNQSQVKQAAADAAKNATIRQAALVLQQRP